MTARSRLAAVAVAALAALPSTSLAQYSPESQYSSSEFFRPHAELTAIAGYQVNTDVDISGGHLSVDDAPVYGAALAWLTHPAIRAELLWLYSNPTVHASGTLALETSAPFHVPTHYFQIGGSTGRRFDRLEPFIGGTLGSALFLPDRINYSNGTSTSLERHLALRLHDRRGTQHPPLGEAGAARRGSGRRARLLQQRFDLCRWRGRGARG